MTEKVSRLNASENEIGPIVKWKDDWADLISKSFSVV
jgi:hypothetical protein